MKSVFLFFLSIGLFIQCSSLRVTSDYDGSVDFGSYKTFSYYGWAKESDKILNDLDKSRIEKAFYKELTSRGMELVQEGGDVVVSLFIVVDQKTAVTAYNNHYGMGGFGGFGGWGWGMGYTTTDFQEHDYYVGTLVCDVFDAGTKKLVWQGVAAGEVRENRKQRERNIPLVIREIMKKYPVKPTS